MEQRETYAYMCISFTESMVTKPVCTKLKNQCTVVDVGYMQE
jgi:hypothetical protein